MRLYKTNYIDDAADPGRTERASWAGTQAEAVADRKRLKASAKRAIVTNEVEFTTDKKGVLAHLNTWEVVV